MDRLHRSKNPAAMAHLPMSGRGGRRDEAGGTIRAGSTSSVRGEAEPAGSGAALWDRPADGGEDAGVLSAARVSAEPAAGAAEAGSYPELALSAQSNEKHVLSSLSGHPANHIVPVRPVATDSSAKVVQKSDAPSSGQFRAGDWAASCAGCPSRSRGNGSARRCGSDDDKKGRREDRAGASRPCGGLALRPIPFSWPTRQVLGGRPDSNRIACPNLRQPRD